MLTNIPPLVYVTNLYPYKNQNVFRRNDMILRYTFFRIPSARRDHMLFVYVTVSFGQKLSMWIVRSLWLLLMAIAFLTLARLLRLKVV